MPVESVCVKCENHEKTHNVSEPLGESLGVPVESPVCAHECTSVDSKVGDESSLAPCYYTADAEC